MYNQEYTMHNVTVFGNGRRAWCLCVYKYADSYSLCLASTEGMLLSLLLLTQPCPKLLYPCPAKKIVILLSYNTHDCVLHVYYTWHMNKLHDVYLVFVWDWHSEGSSVLPDHWSQLIQVGDERTTTVFRRNIHAAIDDLYQHKQMTTLYRMTRTCTTGTHCCLEGPLNWLQSIQTQE